MIDYPGLTALAAVIRTGSFEAAARSLNLTQSAVSQRIRALEDRTGAVLLRRGPPSEPTETGRRLFRHAEEVARLEAGLARDLGDGDRAPVSVRLAANADSLATWLVPALADTRGFLFELVVDDQEHSADLLRGGTVAAAITAHGRAVQGCDTRPLGSLRYIATASPDFAARQFPDGLTPGALEAAPALVFDEKDRLQADWAAWVAGRPVTLPRHRLPSSTAFVDAAILGLGWGMNPEPVVRGHVAEGRLVDLAPDRWLDTPLYWQCSRIGRDTLAPLTRAVLRHARRALVQPGEGSERPEREDRRN